MTQDQPTTSSFALGGARPATGDRSGWVDAARGLGIVLVVFGHVWRGVEAAGLLQNQRLFHLVDSFIYSFHMPLFFVLSGMFFERSVAARSTASFVEDRVLRLLWPLFLWTWIYFLFKALLGSLVNTPAGWSVFPWFPLPPREQFWFLWALFLIQLVLAPLAAGAARAGPNAHTLWVAALVAATAVSALPTGAAAPWFVSALASAPYFVLGVLLGRRPPGAAGPGGVAAALAVFLAAASTAALLAPGHFGALALGAAATLGLVLAMRGLVRSAAGPLQLLGTASLAIYVAHVIFAPAARIGLVALGVDGLAPHLVLGCFAGIVGPLLLFLAARRAGLQRIVGF